MSILSANEILDIQLKYKNNPDVLDILDKCLQHCAWADEQYRVEEKISDLESEIKDFEEAVEEIQSQLDGYKSDLDTFLNEIDKAITNDGPIAAKELIKEDPYGLRS